MWKNLLNHKHQIVLWLMISTYILYFSTFAILRYKNLYAHYYDLGIMHQTVYNTYKGLQTGDLSRILELTTPHKGGEQIKRMAVHNDIILAVIAPFYFIHAGPETLLVIQTVILALGAWAVFKIAQFLLKNESLALAFAFVYLMYTPMQRANNFDFHGVVLATSFILYMVYFWLRKKYVWSYVFLILSLLTKEQVGLSTGLFGLVMMANEFRKQHFSVQKFKNYLLPAGIFLISWGWVFLSFKFIIPSFRTDSHFAEGYYENWLKNAPGYLNHSDTYRYLLFLLGPLAFLTILAPEFLFIAAPEFGINLLSSNWNLRNIVFHYTAIIQPWVFVGSIYGAKRLIGHQLISKHSKVIGQTLSILLVALALLFSYLKGPLPYSKEADLHPFKYLRTGESVVVQSWAKQLADETLKISSTGQMAPFFTSRRYFYNFSNDYVYADYVIISVQDVQKGFENKLARPAYERLKVDTNFEKVAEESGIEVYKKVSSL